MYCGRFVTGLEVTIGSAAAISKVAIYNGHCIIWHNHCFISIRKNLCFLTQKSFNGALTIFQGRGFNILLNLESLSRNFIVNFGSFVCSFRVFLVTLWACSIFSWTLGFQLCQLEWLIAFEEKCSFKSQVRSIQCVLSTTLQLVLGNFSEGLERDQRRNIFNHLAMR